MQKIYLTNCELASIDSFLNLIKKRALEETVNKSININAFSISKDNGFSYVGVKKALTNLDKKIKEML